MLSRSLQVSRALQVSPALQALAIVALMALAGGCGSGDGNRTDSARDVPGPGAAGSLDARTGDSATAGLAGRDPPAAGAAGSATGEDGGIGGTASGEGGWVPNAIVERVVDGDTIVARIGNRAESVRLIGLDAPESVAPTRPVQCFGAEASQFLSAVLPAGTEVTLLRDVEARDVYDRLLGYVVRSQDGLFVNLEMVAAGYAAALTFPPNDRYAVAFDRAEAEAVASGRGLWSDCGGPDVPLH